MEECLKEAEWGKGLDRDRLKKLAKLDDGCDEELQRTYAVKLEKKEDREYIKEHGWWSYVWRETKEQAQTLADIGMLVVGLIPTGITQLAAGTYFVGRGIGGAAINIAERGKVDLSTLPYVAMAATPTGRLKGAAGLVGKLSGLYLIGSGSVDAVKIVIDMTRYGAGADEIAALASSGVFIGVGFLGIARGAKEIVASRRAVAAGTTSGPAFDNFCDGLTNQEKGIIALTLGKPLEYREGLTQKDVLAYMKMNQAERARIFVNDIVTKVYPRETKPAEYRLSFRSLSNKVAALENPTAEALFSSLDKQQKAIIALTLGEPLSYRELLTVRDVAEYLKIAPAERAAAFDKFLPGIKAGRGASEVEDVAKQAVYRQAFWRMNDTIESLVGKPAQKTADKPGKLKGVTLKKTAPEHQLPATYDGFIEFMRKTLWTGRKGDADVLEGKFISAQYPLAGLGRVGPKVHIALPAGAYYQTAGRVVEVLAEMNKALKRPATFKVAREGLFSDRGMNSDQTGKEITIYFDSAAAYEAAKPYLKAMEDIVAKQMKKEGGRPERGENSAREVDLSPNLSVGVRGHYGDTMRIEGKAVAKHIEAFLKTLSPVERKIVEKELNERRSGRDYYLSDDYLRHYAPPIMQQLLIYLYERGGGRGFGSGEPQRAAGSRYGWGQE